MPSKSPYTKAEVERAARLYHSNVLASRALGLASGEGFKDLCERHGIETPNERKRRKATERRAKREAVS